MTDDLIRWEQVQISPSGVGETPGGELTAHAQLPPGVPNPRDRKIRRRHDSRQQKRTDRNPPLAEPPWEMFREAGIPVPPDLICLPHSPAKWRNGPRYLNWKRGVLAMWGDRCWLCGHDQAYTADHVVPVSVWPNQPFNPAIGRPAHGIEGCPTCGIPCNSSRGNRMIARQIKNYKPPVQL